jgi:LPS-assembly protein
MLVFAFTAPCLHAKVDDMRGRGGPAQGPVDITAETLEFDKATNTYIAKGEVEIVEGTRKLTADFVRYNKNTEDVYAEGNVIFTDQGDAVNSDKMYLNLVDKTGTMEKGRIFIKQGHFNIVGEHIEKVGENEYAIKNGQFTTCDLEKPAWKFTSTDVDITMGGYAKTKDTRFYILDYPVFYVPAGIFPVKTDRQSGLLMPELITSSRDGIKIKQSFFWAISKDKDATFWTQYIEKRGFRLGSEFRYALREDLKGGWEASIISDKDYDGTRWEVKGKHEQLIGKDLTFKANIDYVSDYQYIVDFAPTPALRSENLLKSTMYVEKPLKKSLLTVETAYFKNLIIRDNDRTFQYLPHATYFTEYIPLMNGRTYGDIAADVTSFQRASGDTFTRFVVEPSLRLPYKWNGVNLLFSGTFFQAAYLINRRDTEGSSSTNRQTVKIEGDANVNFLRNYQTDFLKLGELQSVIRPQLRYTFIPSPWGGDNPSIDPYDNITKTNSITYSLNHYLNSFSPQWMRELSLMEISQTYSLSEDLRYSEAYKGYGNRLSDINAKITFYPARYITYTNQTVWNTSGQGLSTMRNALSHQVPGVYYVNLNHSYTRDLVNESLLLVGGTYKEFDARTQIRYSFKDQDWIDTLYQLVYHPKCWAVSLTLIQSKRPRDTTLRLAIDLAGITKNY